MMVIGIMKLKDSLADEAVKLSSNDRPAQRCFVNRKFMQDSCRVAVPILKDS